MIVFLAIFRTTSADNPAAPQKKNDQEADILESKLKAEGIPVMRKYEGFANAAEIIMGSNTAFQLDLYVPEGALEDARNIIMPLTQEEIEGLEDIEEADRLGKDKE
jgi:hypothetical protein